MNKILIIDDDKELCELLQRSVLVENINADVCHSGKDGIFLLSTKQYQLIVLDIMMPGLDGFETMAELRKFSRMAVGAARKDVTDVYGEPKKQDGGLLVYRASERAGEPALCFELEEDAVIAIFLATEQI